MENSWFKSIKHPGGYRHSVRRQGLLISLLMGLGGSLPATPPGNMGIYFEAGGGDGLNSTATYTHDFDTIIRQDPGYALVGGNQVVLNRGLHLVLYSSRYRADNVSNSGNNGRASGIGFLSLNGAPQSSGQSFGILRRQDQGGGSDGAVDFYMSGAAILDVPFDGSTIAMQTLRTDNNIASGNDISRFPNRTGLQILKLDDCLPILRTDRTTDAAGPTVRGAAFQTVGYDRLLANAESHFIHDPNGDITLTEGGHYLVLANSGILRPVTGDRITIRQRLTLDGTEIQGTRTTGYPRGNPDNDRVDEGIVAVGSVIEATPGQILRVQLQMESTQGNAGNGSDNTTIMADRTALTIVKLPDNADYLQLTESGNNQNIDDGAMDPVSWSSADEVDAGSFGFTAPGTDITVNQAGDYLFFTRLYTQDSDRSRSVTEFNYRINGAANDIGRSAFYTRNTTGGESGGNFGASLLPGLIAGDTVQVASLSIGRTGTVHLDRGGLSGLPVSALAAIPPHGILWDDCDKDGIRDAEETRYANIGVELWENGTLVDSTTTDANGEYSFVYAMLANTSYEIRVQLTGRLDGFGPTRQDVGFDAGTTDTNDSDFALSANFGYAEYSFNSEDNVDAADLGLVWARSPAEFVICTSDPTVTNDLGCVYNHNVVPALVQDLDARNPGFVLSGISASGVSGYFIDIDSTIPTGMISTENGWTSLDSSGGELSGVVIDGINFFVSSVDGSRLRLAGGNPTPNPLTGDFVFDDGANEAVILNFGGAGALPAGEWLVEMWVWDELAPLDDVLAAYRVNTAETILGSFTPDPVHPTARFTFTSDGISAYDVFIRENNGQDRSRLNAVRLLPITELNSVSDLGECPPWEIEHRTVQATNGTCSYVVTNFTDIINPCATNPADAMVTCTSVWTYTIDREPPKVVRINPGGSVGCVTNNLFNLAPLGQASQSSTRGAPNPSTFSGCNLARCAIDGITDGNWPNSSVTHTANQATPWWKLELPGPANIAAIQLFNRTDCCGNRLDNFNVSIWGR